MCQRGLGSQRVRWRGGGGEKGTDMLSGLYACGRVTRHVASRPSLKMGQGVQVHRLGIEPRCMMGMEGDGLGS